jgi:hypothetical protein
MNLTKGLHFVTGEKGGVGKSLWAMALLEYCQANNITCDFYDADRTSPDVGLIYEPKKYKKIVEEFVETQTQEDYKPIATEQEGTLEHIYFSEDEEDIFLADRLLASAFEHLTLVNLPAQVEVMVTRWLTERGILALAKEEHIDVYFWFVTDGSPESLELLERSLTTYKNELGHIIVCNQGLSKNALFNLQSHRVKAAVEQYALATVEMPFLCLADADKNFLKNEQITLANAAKREKTKKLTLIAKQRIKQFLDQTQIAIKQTGIFVSDTSQVTVN